MTEAIEQGEIVHMNKFAKLPKNTEENEDTSRKRYEMLNQGPNTGPKPYKLPHQIKEQSELKKTVADKKNPVIKEEKDSTTSEEIIQKESNNNDTHAATNVNVSEDIQALVSKAQKVLKSFGVEKTKHKIHEDLNNQYLKAIPTI